MDSSDRPHSNAETPGVARFLERSDMDVMLFLVDSAAVARQVAARHRPLYDINTIIRMQLPLRNSTNISSSNSAAALWFWPPAFSVIGRDLRGDKTLCPLGGMKN